MKKFFFLILLFTFSYSCKKDNPDITKPEILLSKENNPSFIVEKTRGWGIHRTFINHFPDFDDMGCYPPACNCFDDIVIRPEGEKPPPTAPNQRFSVNNKSSYTFWLETQKVRNSSLVKYTFKGGKQAVMSAIQSVDSKYSKYRVLLELIPEVNQKAIIEGTQEVYFYDEIDNGVKTNSKIMIVSDIHTNEILIAIPINEVISSN